MTLKTDAYQIGLDSTTDTNNFLLQTNGAGNLHIHKGSSGTGPVVLRVKSDNTVEIPNGLIGGLTSGTAQNTTSGTSIDFTGIPSWAKRITVMFNGVSTNGTSNLLVQIGSSSIITSGYYSQSNSFAGAGAASYSGVSSTAGFIVFDTVAAYSLMGTMILHNVSGNNWVSNHTIGGSDNRFGGGTSPTLSGTLDRLRLTTVSGTDTFDAGSVNIMYEG